VEEFMLHHPLEDILEKLVKNTRRVINLRIQELMQEEPIKWIELKPSLNKFQYLLHIKNKD